MIAFLRNFDQLSPLVENQKGAITIDFVQH